MLREGIPGILATDALTGDAWLWAFDHALNGVALEELIDADFGWRDGWEYRIE
jgi:hypothetical protein